MPSDLGMMLNDSLGDCTCAGFYHALQVWTFASGKPIDTESDSNVEDLYIDACGYDPSKGGEGNGGVEQDVLTYLLNQGAPIGPEGSQRHKLLAFFEIDPAKQMDVQYEINACGVVYIGFNVPSFLMVNGRVPDVWDVQNQGTNIIGGHCVILAGYDFKGVRVISWGKFYTMTWEFFAAYVDEAYGLVDADWITANGTTPAGMTLAQLEEQMAALKG